MKDIVIFAGHAGAGKRSYAKALLDKSDDWTLLDKDSLLGSMVEFLCVEKGLSPHDRDSEGYLNEVRPQEYKSLFRTIDHLVVMKTPGIIISAPFVKELLIPGFTELMREEFAKNGYRLTVVWVYCDTDVLRRRLEGRGAARDAWKLDNWGSWVDSLKEPVVEAYDCKIDNSADIDGAASAENINSLVDSSLN